jgi:hypothetical protein
MKALLLLALFSAIVVAPALAELPVADACQPYTYYCALDGQLHYGCGTQVPSSCVMSILDP